MECISVQHAKKPNSPEISPEWNKLSLIKFMSLALQRKKMLKTKMLNRIRLKSVNVVILLISIVNKNVKKL